MDTVRSLRSLAVAHQLGHVLRGERDQSISLLQRLVAHAETTARYSIYYGKGRDAFDVRGRTAHESIFNLNDGSYRCPNSQQGYSPFSTWTRGLAWAILGYAEQLEFLGALNGKETGQGTRAPSRARLIQSSSAHDLAASRALFLEAARATADFYLANCCADGIPMWDTGAPQLHRLGAYLSKPADPFNRWEPVDSSAAAIAAQGLVRLGNYLSGQRRREERRRLSAGGIDRGEYPFRRAVSLHESQTPGFAAALGLSSAQRLGLRRAWPEGAERGEFDVGRLPRPSNWRCCCCARRGARRIPPSSPRASEDPGAQKVKTALLFSTDR